MKTPTRNASVAAKTYRSAISVARADLFGITSDPQMPLHLIEDTGVPFLGFAGQDYREGGLLLLAINPGAGNDKLRKRPLQDAELIPLILAFKASDPDEIESTFAAMSSSYIKQAKTWNLWGIVGPVLEASRKAPEEVAFANIFPYRTYKDRKPHHLPLLNAVGQIAKPLISGLKPGTVVALGKKAGEALEGEQFSGRYFVVPRTNGDRYVSAEAGKVLEAIRQHAA